MYFCAGKRAAAAPFGQASVLLSILAAGRDDEALDDDDVDGVDGVDEDDDEDDETDATLIRVPGLDEAYDDEAEEKPGRSGEKDD